MTRSGASSQPIVLRPATAEDLSELETLPFGGGLPSKHCDRFERQARGEAVYLLAYADDRIAGHLLLVWDGPSAPKVRTMIAPWPRSRISSSRRACAGEASAAQC